MALERLKKFLIYKIYDKSLFLYLKEVNNIMLNENSIVVRTWFSAVMSGVYKYSQVPNLSNLREEVAKKLVAMGYDIENEDA